MLRESDFTSLRQGRFELDCLHMELVYGDPELPVSYEGPGRIYQTPDGQLRLTLYAPNAPPRLMPDPPVGVRIPPEAYWSFRATDYHGRDWRAPRVLLNPGWSQPGRGSVLSATLPYIEAHEQLEQAEPGGSFTGYVFRDLRLPANRRTQVRTERDTEWREEGQWDAAVANVGTVKLLFHQEPEQLRVSAGDPETPLHPHFAERVREALQFISAFPLSWALTEEERGRTRRLFIRGRPSATAVPRIQPPVARHVAYAEVPTWRLFEAYFAYVCRDISDGLHRVSAEWAEVLRSSTGTVETEALIAAVTVESLCRYLREQQPALGAAAAAAPGSWAEKVDGFLAQNGADDRLRKRVRGVFGKMKSTDHTDALMELQQVGAIEPRLVEVWSRWRHIMAHGDREAQTESEELSRATSAVVTLLYQLYFHIIGYRGLYTDFSQYPWRAASYPPGTVITDARQIP